MRMMLFHGDAMFKGCRNEGAAMSFSEMELKEIEKKLDAYLEENRTVKLTTSGSGRC